MGLTFRFFGNKAAESPAGVDETAAQQPARNKRITKAQAKAAEAEAFRLRLSNVLDQLSEADRELLMISERQVSEL